MSETRRSSGYPSDLTDSQWARLESLLPQAHTVGRHRTISSREVANAINYRWETGCVWRMLPHDFPPWGTVYAYFRDWQRAGVVRQLRDILTEAQPKTRPRSGLAGPAHGTQLMPSTSPGEKTSPHPVKDRPQRSAEESGFSSPKNRIEGHSSPQTNPADLPP